MVGDKLINVLGNSCAQSFLILIVFDNFLKNGLGNIFGDSDFFQFFLGEINEISGINHSV